jgi:hypothetical protein
MDVATGPVDPTEGVVRREPFGADTLVADDTVDWARAAEWPDVAPVAHQIPRAARTTAATPATMAG